MDQRQQISLLTPSIEPLPVTSQVASYDSKIVGEYDETTLKLFGALQGAYNYFKVRLFKDRLSPAVLTLNRNTRSGGYYMRSAWVDETQNVLPEINISPATLQLSPLDVMSILVHEMTHHFQHLHGNPGRAGYHNKEFAKFMFCLGLQCSSTGEPGGKQTGERMSHFVLPGGTFHNAFEQMPNEYLLPFKDFNLQKKFTSFSIKKIKIKYQCTGCGINVWGKPNLHIVCEQCDMRLAIVENIGK